MSDAIETFKCNGFTVKIYPDRDAPSPREWDNISVIACWHRSLRLGDRQIQGTASDRDRASFVAELGERVLAILPVWIYQHGDVALAACNDNPFSCRFDSGQVGWAYVTESSAKKVGCEGLTEGTYLEYIRQEVADYDRWGRGLFCGFVVEDEDGDEVESCWNFDDVDYCRTQARAAADAAKPLGYVAGGCTASCDAVAEGV
jgi:hypothetical protein